MCNKVNGYSNTWTYHASLWIDNNSYWHGLFSSMAADSLDANGSELDACDTLEAAMRDILSRSETWTLTSRFSDFHNDLLTMAMEHVNWRELAQGFIETEKENRE